jgi:hypothetical protein
MVKSGFSWEAARAEKVSTNPISRAVQFFMRGIVTRGTQSKRVATISNAFGAGSMAFCAAPPGLLSLFYLHPDLPVWANSFRASGAAHLCRPSGALVSFLTFTQTCRSGLTHFAPPALRSGRKSDASKHLIRQADRNGGKLTHRNTVIRQADCNGRKLMHRNISSVRKIAVAES